MHRRGGGMKKRMTDDYWPAAKRMAPHMTSSNLEARILIPSKVAGAIIGKGGENVKRLKELYNANVIIPDSSAPERIVAVESDLESVCNVILDTLPKLEDKNKGTGVDVELKILIHKSIAGAVIGRAGFKIKELREQTGCDINVFPDVCPMSTDRVVSVTGQPNDVLKGFREVMQICIDTPIKGMVVLYDTGNYDPAGIFEYGGYAPTRDWRPKERPAVWAAGMRSPMGGMGMDMDMGMGMGMMGGGSILDRRYAMRAEMGGMGMGIRRAPRSMAMEPFGMAEMPYSASGLPSLLNDEPVQTQQVTIPKELAGVVIGRGGDKLYEIREASGAYIQVQPLQAGANDRVVTITGTQSCINSAQYLLQQCIRTNPLGRKYFQDRGK